MIGLPQTLKHAEPLGEAFDCVGIKGTERYFYERLNMPDSYIVMGDALAHLNPRFGSGMSASAFQVGCLLAIPACPIPLSDISFLHLTPVSPHSLHVDTHLSDH